MADTQLSIPPLGSKPSYLNRSMAAAALGAAVLPIGGLIGIALIPVAAVVGAYFGKREQEKGEAQGRLVEKPGLLKTEALKDGLIGAGLGHIAGFITIGAIAMTAVSLGTAIPAIVATAMLVTAIAAPIVGGFLGLKHGKNRMEYEWKAAKEYVAANGEYKGQDQSPSIAQSISQERYKDTITPAEYRAMQEKMAAGKPSYITSEVNSPILQR